MPAKKLPASSFQVPRSWQIMFICIAALVWSMSFWYLLFWGANSYISVGTWVFQITQIVLPFLWFLVALWFVWNQYKPRLHKAFAASFLTFLGFGVFTALASLEQSLRYRFYPPVIVNPSDDSLITAFGHDWLIQGVGIVAFVALVVWIKFRRQGKLRG